MKRKKYKSIPVKYKIGYDCLGKYLEYVNEYPLRPHMICGQVEYVYVMYNYHTKLFKIGKTEEIKKRIADISNIAGGGIDLLWAWQPTPDFDESATLLERNLHEYYYEKRRIGEWFALSIYDLYRLYEFFLGNGDELIDESERILKNVRNNEKPNTYEYSYRLVESPSKRLKVQG